MTENEKDQDLTELDAVWELKKMNRRLLDVWDEIDALKAKDKSTDGKIARLWAALRGAQEEGEEEPEEEREHRARGLDDLSAEERAVLISRLLDQAQTP